MLVDNRTILFAGAALAALATFAVHTFVGGVFVARPLLADRTLPRASKWLNYYCWHVTTILLLGMTAAFGRAATNGVATDLSVAVTILSGCLSALSGWTAIRGGINPLRFPSTSLFALICVLGAAAIHAD
jgi:hypothetical protein